MKRKGAFTNSLFATQLKLHHHAHTMNTSCWCSIYGAVTAGDIQRFRDACLSAVEVQGDFNDILESNVVFFLARQPPQ